MRGYLKCVDKNYNIIYLKKDDPLIKERKVTWILKKYITAKDINGKTIMVFDNDLRLKTGELFPATTKHIINCDKHGRQHIEQAKMMNAVKIPEEYKIKCPECAKYYLSDNYNPSELDKTNCIKALKNIHFSCSNQQVPMYFKRYMPQFYKIINDFTLENILLSFSKKIYFVKNEIYEVPICNLNGCFDKTELSTGNGFNMYCEKHKNCNYSSKKENEVYNLYFSKLFKRNTKKL